MQTAISVNTPALGDTLAVIPTIRKVSKAYETPITVFTQFPELFQNHPCVKEAFPLNASKEGYNVLNTFSHLAGKTHNLNGNKVQFKYAHTDSRQYHALSLGFTLLPEEMETDLYVEENWEINFKNYIVIHASNTWPARTWSQDKWQNLVYKLNELNIPVVAIGKSLIEHGNLATYDKSVMSIEIPYGINLMDHPESSIPKVRNIINKARGVVTMDSGILHLAGTTDTHIIQLGFNGNPKWRAPYRKGTQNYKYTYVKGSCDLQCASSLKYNLKVHGHLQETPPVATCLENKPTFECHPKVEDVVRAVKELPIMKQKLLYITPHLSTGGAPQYLLKKIELLKEEYDISLVEYTDLGGKSFVVQKNKIFNIISPKNRITLGEDKTQLLDFLDKIQPDVVHLEEIPELFMDNEVAEILYGKNRNYTIFETSHDSSQNPENKRFIPDKFMFVSNWQIEQYKDINVPSVLVEYPIEYKENKNREKACKRLGLNPNKKHIIHVGLFTPRKNQAEFFEYARAFPEYEFHCIGNQAINFKHYWEPLMKNKPDNLTWWGERNDVDNFYEAADLFLFTSKGNSHDKETMPLVIREALSWKLPILIYNLEVYQNYFDNYPVKYLIDNKEQNIKNITNIMEGFEIISSSITAEDFDISLKGENKINFAYKKAEQFDCKIVVKEKYSNAPMYWFEANFANYVNWWCVPNQQFSLKDSWLTELTLEFYTLSDKFLFSKDLFIKENGIKPSIKLELANNFDCLFQNYAEIFVEKKYDFLFEDKLSTVLDIGANAGIFCKLFLEKGVNKVYAFEPNQDALTNLNYLASKEPNLKVIEKAVHTNEKDLKFYITPNNTTIGSINKFHIEQENVKVEEIIVPTITLKNFIKQEKLNKIDLIKIDIEGAEYDIIENLEDEIFNITDKFLIEWHDNTKEQLNKLVLKLKSKGYSITKTFDQNTSEDLSENYLNHKLGTLLVEKINILTVVIPTYNHENYIEQCIDSVLSQKTDFNFNILISDDCSTDNTFNILQKYKDIPNVTIHQTPKNIGPTGERMHSLYREISSKYITILDGDDYYVDNYKLQKQVNFLNNNPEYILHSTGYFHVSPEGKQENTVRYSTKEIINSYSEIIEANFISHGFMFRNILNWNTIPSLPYESNPDCRWSDNILLTQLGKAKNEKWVGGAYRLTPNSQFSSKTEEERISLSEQSKIWNQKYFLQQEKNNSCAVHLHLYLTTQQEKETAFANIKNIKSKGFSLIVTSPLPLPSSFYEYVDIFYHTKENQLFNSTYENVETIFYWSLNNKGDKLNFSRKEGQPHGLAVLRAIINGCKIAQLNNISNIIKVEYDDNLGTNTLEYIKNTQDSIYKENYDFFVYKNSYKNQTPDISTHLMFYNVNSMLNLIGNINDEQDYKSYLTKLKKTNQYLILEQFLFYCLKHFASNFNICFSDFDLNQTDTLWNTHTFSQENFIADVMLVKHKGVIQKDKIALGSYNIKKYKELFDIKFEIFDSNKNLLGEYIHNFKTSKDPYTIINYTPEMHTVKISSDYIPQDIFINIVSTQDKIDFIYSSPFVSSPSILELSDENMPS